MIDCTEIDLLIKKSVDPRIIWDTIRNTYQEEVPTLMIAKLEHDYVDILLNKKVILGIPIRKTLRSILIFDQ